MAQMSNAAAGVPLGDGGINQRKIFFASFMTLVAAGVGFGVRGGVLGDLGGQFGFTKSDLGAITGGGLAGFGITINLLLVFSPTGSDTGRC